MPMVTAPPVVTRPIVRLVDSQTTAQTNTVLVDPAASANIYIKAIHFTTNGATTFSLFSATAGLLYRADLGAAGSVTFDTYGEPGEWVAQTLTGEDLTYSTTGTNNTTVIVHVSID